MRAKGIVVATLIAAAAVSITSQHGLAQQPSTQTFSSRSELVLVPVLARKDNKPVTDLKREDFVILDDGKSRPVTSFEAPPAEPPRSTPVTRGLAQFKNVGQEPPRQLTIIALDPLNTQFGNMSFARDAVLRFLNSSIDTNTRIAVVYLTMGGFKIVHDFSQDPEILRKAVEKARLDSNLAPIEGNSIAISATASCLSCVRATESAIFDAMSAPDQSSIAANMTADDMRAIAQNFGRLPGRKTLIWVTDGFRKIQPRPVLAGAVSGESGQGTPTAIWESAFRALNDGNLAVYPVHATGLKAFTRLSCRGCPFGSEELIQHNERLDTLMWVADETGGQAFFNSNDILHSIQLAASDSDSAYMLAFRLPSDAKKGWHRLQVKVNRPGVHIVARKGYFAGQRPAGQEQELSTALQSPFPYTELPLTVRWSPAAAGDTGKKVVKYRLSIPAGVLQVDAGDRNHVSFELRTQARDVEMKTASDLQRDFTANLSPESLAKFNTDGFTYESQLELPPGEYDVRFVVRDKLNGRLGALTAPLSVP